MKLNSRLLNIGVLIASILNIVIAFTLKYHPFTDWVVMAVQCTQGLALVWFWRFWTIFRKPMDRHQISIIKRNCLRASSTLRCTASGVIGHRPWSAQSWPPQPSPAVMSVSWSDYRCQLHSSPTSLGVRHSTSTVESTIIFEKTKMIELRMRWPSLVCLVVLRVLRLSFNSPLHKPRREGLHHWKCRQSRDR